MLGHADRSCIARDDEHPRLALPANLEREAQGLARAPSPPRTLTAEDAPRRVPVAGAEDHRLRIGEVRRERVEILQAVLAQAEARGR